MSNGDKPPGAVLVRRETLGKDNQVLSSKVFLLPCKKAAPDAVAAAVDSDLQKLEDTYSH